MTMIDPNDPANPWPDEEVTEDIDEEYDDEEWDDDSGVWGDTR